MLVISSVWDTSVLTFSCLAKFALPAPLVVFCGWSFIVCSWCLLVLYVPSLWKSLLTTLRVPNKLEASLFQFLNSRIKYTLAEQLSPTSFICSFSLGIKKLCENAKNPVQFLPGQFCPENFGIKVDHMHWSFAENLLFVGPFLINKGFCIVTAMFFNFTVNFTSHEALTVGQWRCMWRGTADQTWLPLISDCIYPGVSYR